MSSPGAPNPLNSANRLSIFSFVFFILSPLRAAAASWHLVFCNYHMFIVTLPCATRITEWTHLKDPGLYSFRYGQFINVDMSQVMRMVVCLILDPIISVSPSNTLKHTSSAGFHHMSTRITLLHAVKFRPTAMLVNNAWKVKKPVQISIASQTTWETHQCSQPWKKSRCTAYSCYF